MRKSKFNESQIVGILKDAEAGVPGSLPSYCLLDGEAYGGGKVRSASLGSSPDATADRLRSPDYGRAGGCPRARVLRGSLPERRPGDVVETFTILTTEAKATMRALHHRMPVVLAEEAFRPWLSGEDVRLAPAPEDLLTMHHAGLRVNNPRNDGPEYIVAVGTAW